MQGVNQNQLSGDHSCTLEIDSLPAVVLECFHIEQCRIGIRRDLGHKPLKVRKERRIVERPF
jgi:hypothetical protein